jgi:hypothetical protein
VLKLINEKALMQESDQIKEAYMFDYLIQIDLTTVNGMTFGNQIDPGIKKSVANIFFKVINTFTNLLYSFNLKIWME